MARRRFATGPVALSVLVLTMGTPVRAQHGDTKEAAQATAPAAPAATAASGKPAETGAAHGAAKPGGTTTTARPSTPAAAPKPDVKSVVERIQARIDAELGPPSATGTAPPRKKPSTATASPSTAPRRIHLAWRVSLVWPDELLQGSTPAVAAATVVRP